VMFHLGISVTPGEYRAAWRSPLLMLKGLFASLIAVPAVVIVVARAFDLSRAEEIGMVLMAICPSAPVAVRRALGAGADRSFAATLQVTAALLAAATMSLTIAALAEVYAGNATVAPLDLARQVFVGQLLPLGLGMMVRSAAERWVPTLERLLARVAAGMLFVLLVVVLLNVWGQVAGAGLRVAFAVAVAALCAVGVGHLLGGPQASTRTALGIACGARNVGLALFVASINHASPQIMATILTYMLVAAVALTPYVAWRRRVNLRSRNPRLP
jgi:BASS family bile acid:Na+ symporter